MKTKFTPNMGQNVDTAAAIATMKLNEQIDTVIIQKVGARNYGFRLPFPT